MTEEFESRFRLMLSNMDTDVDLATHYSRFKEKEAERLTATSVPEDQLLQIKDYLSRIDPKLSAGLLVLAERAFWVNYAFEKHGLGRAIGGMEPITELFEIHSKVPFKGYKEFGGIYTSFKYCLDEYSHTTLHQGYRLYIDFLDGKPLSMGRTPFNESNFSGLDLRDKNSLTDLDICQHLSAYYQHGPQLLRSYPLD